MLRIDGRDLDVDRMLTELEISASGIYRRGELRRLSEHPSGKRFERSGFGVCVSDAGFHEFERQIAEVIEWLEHDGQCVKQIRDYPGVDELVLDFGIRWEDCAAQFDRLPADLVRLAGSFGLAIEISHYPVSQRSPETTEGSE